MNLNTIKQTRQQIRQCFARSGDALFELADALSCESTARSLPELSLSPTFRRKWPSIYEALEDGRIESQHWSQVWTAALLAEHEGPIWVSIDATSITRPEAETSSDRGIIYVSNLPRAKRPVSVGWQFSTVMLLPNRREPLGSDPLSRAHQKLADSRWGRHCAVGTLASFLAGWDTGVGRSLVPDRTFSAGLSTS